MVKVNAYERILNCYMENTDTDSTCNQQKIQRHQFEEIVLLFFGVTKHPRLFTKSNLNPKIEYCF